MSDAMVTGRMPRSKKEQGARVLQRSGMNVSQVINLVYDRMIKEGNLDFLVESSAEQRKAAWTQAASFVDSLGGRRASRFDAMSKAQIKLERFASREEASRKKSIREDGACKEASAREGGTREEESVRVSRACKEASSHEGKAYKEAPRG